MFREITRSKQKLPSDECAEILTEETRGVLSVLGDDGYPYGMPMNHWYDADDGCIYFHCGKIGHRIDSLHRCDKVSYCVYDRGTRAEGAWAYDVRSVIVFGRMEIIADTEEILRVARALSHKFTQDEAYIENEIVHFAKATLILRLTPEHITGKRVNEA